MLLRTTPSGVQRPKQDTPMRPVHSSVWPAPHLQPTATSGNCGWRRDACYLQGCTGIPHLIRSAPLASQILTLRKKCNCNLSMNNAVVCSTCTTCRKTNAKHSIIFSVASRAIARLHSRPVRYSQTRRAERRCCLYSSAWLRSIQLPLMHWQGWLQQLTPGG